MRQNMFTLQPKPTFKAEVSIPVAGADAATITVEFKHMGRKALATYFENLTVDGVDRQDVDALDDLIANWSGVDQKYSKDNLAQLLDGYPGATSALFETYRVALIEGRRKN